MAGVKFELFASMYVHGPAWPDTNKPSLVSRCLSSVLTRHHVLLIIDKIMQIKKPGLSKTSCSLLFVNTRC